MGTETTSRLKRQKVPQFSVDHIGTEKLRQAYDNSFNHSDAFQDRSSLQLENSQLALQLADNRLQFLMLERLDGKRFCNGAFAAYRIVRRHDAYLRCAVRAWSRSIVITFLTLTRRFWDECLTHSNK